MSDIPSDAAPCVAPSSAALGPATSSPAARAATLIAAARRLLPALEAGQPIGTTLLREAMTAAFGGTDAEGLWDWKTAYDACEAAEILFLRKRSEEHTSELQSLMRISYAVFCLKKKTQYT